MCKNNGKGAVAHSWARSLAVAAPVLMVAAAPLPAVAETVLDRGEVSNVLRIAVLDHIQRTEKRKIIESACYFDPQAKNSTRCSARWAGRNSGADRNYMREKLKSEVRSYCKEAGGNNCTLLFRNGKLEFDGLSPKQSEGLVSVLGKIPSYDVEAKPLPDGVGIGSAFRVWFPGGRDRFDDAHRKNKWKNHHFAICANDAGAFSVSSAQGGGANVSEMRNTCILTCTALSEVYSEEGGCYVVYEDGKFVSEAAEQAVMQ